MGLLMRGQRLHITFAILLLAGCGGNLRLERPMNAGQDDWPVFGRTPEHSSTARMEIRPPLELVWEYDLSAGAANGAPLIVDSVLFVGNLRGELHAVHIGTGKRLGWIGLGDAINGTPAFNGKTVYVPLTNTAKSLVAFDCGTGKARWDQQLGEIEASVVFSDQHLFLGNLEGTFFCVDASTGETSWKYSIPDNTALKGIRSTAAVSSTSVFFGADDGALYSLETRGGRLRWRHPTGAPVIAPVVSDSLTVLAANLDGTVIALSPDSGRVLWSFPAGRAVRGHPLLTPDLAIVATTGGVIYGLDRTSGTPRWMTRTGGAVSAGPTASGNILYVGTQKRECLALRLTDGTVVWKTTVGGRVKTSPVAAYGRVVILTDEKVMLAFRSTPTP
jgi:outer membrane protein assembly factor BamB